MRCGYDRVTSDQALTDWMNRRAAWHQETHAWIAQHLSAIDAERFRQPAVLSVSIGDSYNDNHKHGSEPWSPTSFQS